MKLHHPVLRLAGLCTALLATEGLHAQTQPAQPASKLALEELTEINVIITPQKRAQNLQEVPVAVTAFTGERLNALGASSVQSLPDLVPGLRMISSGTDAITVLSLRGVGQRNIADQNEGATILFVDDTYVNFQGAVAQPFYDMDRVEVVKGPQGTLFGRNATGGLVHAISKRPTRENEGYVTLGYGSYDQVKVEGALNAPLSETLSGRLSFSSEQYDGYIENIGGGPDVQAHEHYSGRLQLLFEPEAGKSFLLNARATIWPDQQGPANRSEPLIVDSSGVARRPESYAEYAAFCTGLGFAPPPAGSEVHGTCLSAASSDELKTDATAMPSEARYYAIAGTAQIELSESVTFTSISDYQQLERTFVNDVDGSDQALMFYQARVPKAWQVSQEMRLNGVTEKSNWIAGLYYLYIDNHSVTAFENSMSAPLFASFLADYTQVSKSYAAFGQVDYVVAPSLTLTVGARYTHDFKSMDNVSSCEPGPFVPIICDALQMAFPATTVAFDGYRGSMEKDDWSARLVLDWKASEQLMLYAGVNRGIKSGGFNAGIFQGFTAAQVPFGSETLLAYEGGMKSTLFDGAANVNASLFYYDYSDFQSYELVGTGQYTFNVDAEIKGAELEVAVRPATGWVLTGAVTHLDSVQKDIPTAAGPRDFPIPDAPRWSLNGNVLYGWNVATGTMSAMVNGSYVDERTVTAITFADIEMGSYSKFDARVTYKHADGRWSASAFVNNLTDERTEAILVPAAGLLGAAPRLYDPPRWYGVSVTVSY